MNHCRQSRDNAFSAWWVNEQHTILIVQTYLYFSC